MNGENWDIPGRVISDNLSEEMIFELQLDIIEMKSHINVWA